MINAHHAFLQLATQRAHLSSAYRVVQKSGTHLVFEFPTILDAL